MEEQEGIFIQMAGDGGGMRGGAQTGNESYDSSLMESMR